MVAADGRPPPLTEIPAVVRYCAPVRAALATEIQAKIIAPKLTTFTMSSIRSGSTSNDSTSDCPERLSRLIRIPIRFIQTASPKAFQKTLKLQPFRSALEDKPDTKAALDVPQNFRPHPGKGFDFGRFLLRSDIFEGDPDHSARIVHIAR